MGEQTKIQWTDHTFNGWVGCEKVSPGCKHCYAAVDTYARVSASRGLPLWGPGSSRHVTSDANWRKPLAWNRAAEREGVRRRVFCASLSDVFEDRPDLLVPRARLWRLIAETTHLDWLLLTKRPENAERLALQAWSDAFAYSTSGGEPEGWWLPNIWLGTTCEDRERYMERWPILAHLPARVRFISHEPALGPIADLFAEGLVGHGEYAWPDWIITGGESGPKARFYDLAWARRLLVERAQVRRRHGKDVAIFVKQLGAKVLGRDCEHGRTDAPCSFEDPKGGNWDEWPQDLRVREWPRG